MSYVDGFVLAVPKDNLEAYKEIARKAGEVWMEHGALAYAECTGDDVPYGEVTSFPRAVQAKDDEIVVFSWVVYEFAQAPRRDRGQGHGRPAHEGRRERYALRRQAHDLRRLPAVHGVAGAYPSKVKASGRPTDLHFLSPQARRPAI